MHDKNTLKRNRVKKAAIIFFTVMLILTFFSNTIMNYSLPQVSVQCVKEGKITTSIRGSGTAEAIGNYEVMISQSRKVDSVLVQQGDTVNAGDVLFLLDHKESDELKTAHDELYNLNLQYQKMLINWPAADYTQENRDIERTRQELKDAMTERDKNAVSRQQIDNAEHSLNSAKQKVSELTDEVERLQAELNDVTGTGDEAIRSLERQIEDKKRQINNAGSGKVRNPVSLDSLQLELKRLKEDYDLLIAKYPDYNGISTELENSKIALQEAEQELVDAEENNAAQDVLDSLRQNVEALKTKVNELKNKLNDSSELTSLMRRIEDKEEEIAHYQPYLQDEYSADAGQLRRELRRLEEDYEDMCDENKDYDRVNKKLKKTNTDLSEANKALEEAQEKYDKLHEKYEKWKSADEEVTRFQNNLEDLLFAMEKSRKNNEKTSAIADLDLQKLQKEIAEQKCLVDELQADAEEGKVVADQAGIIKSINIAAGGTTAPNMTMAVIETTSQGYSLSFSVTKEQSQKVSVGDNARIDDNNVSATLKQIKNDPANPGKNKILTFLLEGEVESGDIFSLSLEQTGAAYDCIVPGSALHQDSNGTFILTVESQKTAFGSRYTAKRISVEVLAEDDQNTAVSGALRQSDYVITASTELLEPGMNIRMMNQ